MTIAATMEKVQFLLDELNPTNPEHADAIESLQAIQTVATLSPRGEERFLEPGEQRAEFKSRTDMLRNLPQFYDRSFVLWMRNAQSYVVDWKEAGNDIDNQ